MPWLLAQLDMPNKALNKLGSIKKKKKSKSECNRCKTWLLCDLIFFRDHKLVLTSGLLSYIPSQDFFLCNRDILAKQFLETKWNNINQSMVIYLFIGYFLNSVSYKWDTPTVRLLNLDLFWYIWHEIGLCTVCVCTEAIQCNLCQNTARNGQSFVVPAFLSVSRWTCTTSISTQGPTHSAEWIHHRRSWEFAWDLRPFLFTAKTKKNNQCTFSSVTHTH